MSLLNFHGVSIAAVSTVVPADEIRLEDETAYYGGSPAKVRQVTAVSGLDKRRVAPDGVTASDLCAQAAEVLFAETGADKAAVGAVLFVSQGPDYLLPASAGLAHHALGLPADCASLDLNSGCTGYVHALWMGAGLIASGACQSVLLLVGDTPGRFLNPANRVTAPVFGDAGTATLLERRDDAPPMSFLFGTDGSGYESLVIPGGGSRIPQRRDEGPDSPFKQTVTDPAGNPWTLGDYGQLWMDGMAVFTFGVTVVPAHIKRHLELAGLDADGIDYLLLHQANRLMVETIAKKAGVKTEKTPWGALAKYGNLGAASLGALVCDTAAEKAPGAFELPSLLCGFGAGLAWGSCLCSFKDTRILPVRDYAPEGRIPSRDEKVAYWHGKFGGK